MNAERIKVVVRGAVQGVGFRPYVYCLATELGLKGRVLNSNQGVLIEAESTTAKLQEFLLRLASEAPPLAKIHSLETAWLDPVGFADFEIVESESGGDKTAMIHPDIATCDACVREIFDPQNRRYHYPFTNCTHCGPRFSILEALPYDRQNTSMKAFRMCAACEAEYHEPRDRRFHAQPNACPACGPQLEIWDRHGDCSSSGESALLQAADAVSRGEILALKGVGGFHLMVDARNESAVRRLRDAKSRQEKPFALMYPTLAAIRRECSVSVMEARLLASPEAPIVLLSKLRSSVGAVALAASVAPGNPYLGIMLPYSPLHHLLLDRLGFPVVATSGNLSDEPICIGESEALQRLRDVADCYLVHNRPIVRPVDDSVCRVMLDRQMVLRRSRGYAPLPLSSKLVLPELMAVGAHAKNTVAFSKGHQVFLSQHIGDLETQPAFAAFGKVVEDYQRIYEISPEAVACDPHPDYLSTKYADKKLTNHYKVQHHLAHVAACMADNELSGTVLGVVWDGSGLGSDGNLWGGEFLKSDGEDFERVAQFRSFRLPGGAAAIKEPRRAALGLLFAIFGETVFHRRSLATLREFSQTELPILKNMLKTGVNSPISSSAGRLFDAVASLVGLRQRGSFEGQAAMELEFAALPDIEDCYPVKMIAAERWIFDWQATILEIIEDLAAGVPTGIIAAKFHNTLVDVIVQIARRIREPRVVLTGGCFQNRYLTERAVRELRRAGFQPYWHQRVPPNDGGIALGQIAAVAQRLRKAADQRQADRQCGLG